MTAIQDAFAKAGVVFLEAGNTRNGVPGVRLAKSHNSVEGKRPDDLNATNDD
jgi:hypothetical protein